MQVKQSLSSRPSKFFNLYSIMLRKVLLSLSVAACVSGTANAQLQPCWSDEHHNHLLKVHPQLAEYEQQFEEQVAAKLAAKLTEAGDANDTVYYDVPLVVHVVHDYGVENLSDDDIYEAAKNWALAFVKKNADTATVLPAFVPYIGNARIRLHLATIDPNGNPTKGVVRHNSYLTFAAADEAKYQSWPNNKYINIWFINSFGSSGAAAYAYYPSSGAFMPYYDGVISLASYLNTSKTIPHELGHVLNLQHVWGNNNNAGVACGNDAVDDTPPTKGHTPGCVSSALFDTDCAVGYMKTYISMSGLADSVVDYPDTTNAQNIMDYTYCSNMFTKGQCARMRKALTSATAGRNNLITTANLAQTGALAEMPDLPPVADFYVGKATAVGIVTDLKTKFLTFDNDATFLFRNASWNDTISSVHWEFSNGAAIPTSSSTGIVNNKFSVPGWVTVSLTATSNAGSGVTIDRQAVYAADTTPVGGLGYSQSFASAGDIFNWPMMNYYQNQFRWQHFTGAGKDDNSCIRYRSFDTSDKIYGTASGDYDDIFTPAFNLEGVTGDLYLNFFSAGMVTSLSSSASRDSLEVDVTTSGGVRWVKLGGYRGTELANNGSKSSEFIPGTSSSWAARAISVPAAYRTRQTFFRLRYRPGDNGNNLYVDNLAFSSLPAEIQDISQSDDQFVLYPNPAANGSTLAFRAGNDGNVKISVRDISGRIVFEQTEHYAPNSVNSTLISREKTPAAGMYIVTVTTGGANITGKLLVY